MKTYDLIICINLYIVVECRMLAFLSLLYFASHQAVELTLDCEEDLVALLCWGEHLSIHTNSGLFADLVSLQHTPVPPLNNMLENTGSMTGLGPTHSLPPQDDLPPDLIDPTSFLVPIEENITTATEQAQNSAPLSSQSIRPLLLEAFKTISKDPILSLSAISSLCNTPTSPSGDDLPQGSYLSQILLTLYKSFPTESDGIQLLAEFCAFWNAKLHLDLDILRDVQAHYSPPPLPHNGETLLHAIQMAHKQLQLTYTLQNLMMNLTVPTNRLQTLLLQLNLDPLDVTNALSEAYDLLHGLKKNPNIQKTITVDVVAQLLCTRDSQCSDALSCLQELEFDEMQFFIEMNNPLSKPKVKHPAIVAVWQRIIQDPTQIRSAIAEIYQNVFHVIPSESEPLSSILSSVLNSFESSKHYPESSAIQGLTECCGFLVSNQPLDLKLLSEVQEQYPSRLHMHNHTSPSSILNIHTMRKQAKLTYTLQAFKNQSPSKSEGLKSLLERFKIDSSDLDQALFNALNLWQGSPATLITRSIAHELCPARLSCKAALDVLLRIENSEQTPKQSPQSKITDYSSKYTRFKTSEDEEKNCALPFFLESLKKILADPSQAFSVLRTLYHEIYKTPPQSDQSFASLFEDIHYKLRSYPNYTRITNGSLPIVEIFAFILSEPSFDTNLFQEVQRRYPEPIAPSKDILLMKIRKLRMQMKITYSLQTLKENLREPFIATATTLESLLQHLDLSALDAPELLQQTYTLTRHPNLVFPLKVFPAQHLCTDKIPTTTAIKIIKDAEESLNRRAWQDARQSNPQTTETQLQDSASNSLQHSTASMCVVQGEKPSVSIRKRKAHDDPEPNTSTKTPRPSIHTKSQPEVPKLPPAAISIPLDGMITTVLERPYDAYAITKILPSIFPLHTSTPHHFSDVLSSIQELCYPTHKYQDEHLKIQVLGEIFSFLLSNPPFRIELLREVQQHYPNNTQSEENTDTPTHTLWMQIQLSYTLQNLMCNLPPSDDPLAIRLQHLGLDQLSLAQALTQGYHLLHGVKRHPSFTYPLIVNSTAKILCFPGVQCHFVLETLQKIERATNLSGCLSSQTESN